MRMLSSGQEIYARFFDRIIHGQRGEDGWGIRTRTCTRRLRVSVGLGA
jgi:hypothetical protein